VTGSKGSAVGLQHCVSRTRLSAVISLNFTEAVSL